ncbi:hypothetical protein LOK49_LG03G01194 [Camellia lanceoleosa]|uniref:Uncharacterized protein n=1 Tax=Camellia lanceoleosa TaxID=1840588 RepID=A0ACC0ICQ8_9ERIC|nr:hypothetical protein LOK49_LG03G01194 [Camellia lanceoleosa]
MVPFRVVKNPFVGVVGPVLNQVQQIFSMNRYTTRDLNRVR